MDLSTSWKLKSFYEFEIKHPGEVEELHILLYGYRLTGCYFKNRGKKMAIDYLEYKMNCFPEQLEKACLFRGESIIREICDKLNVQETQFQLLKTGALVPDIKVILTLANVLKMDLCYFFLLDASCHHFDLLAFADKI